MNSNELLFFLRGFFELVPAPTPEQVNAIRNEILRAKPVIAELIPVEVINPTHRVAGTGGCGGGCGGTPAPRIDASKI